MIIEKEVLDMVGKYLTNGDKAYFQYGTLWIQTSEDVARKIWHFLYDAYDGEVAVSKSGGEFAIDFI